MTDAQDPQSPQRRNGVRDFARHVRHQPRWHKGLLGIMLVLAALGIVGQVRAHLTKPRIVERSGGTASGPGAVTPANSPGFVSQTDAPQATAPAAADRVPTAPAQDNDLLTRVSPVATRLG